jgi:superoxide dismutase
MAAPKAAATLRLTCGCKVDDGWEETKRKDHYRLWFLHHLRCELVCVWIPKCELSSLKTALVDVGLCISRQEFSPCLTCQIESELSQAWGSPDVCCERWPVSHLSPSGECWTKLNVSSTHSTCLITLTSMHGQLQWTHTLANKFPSTLLSSFLNPPVRK